MLIHAIQDFERHPLIEVKVGEKKKVTFEDDGNFVNATALKNAGAKFPRDSHVFTVSLKGEKMEYWVAAQSYSVMKQLKRLRSENNNTLVGLNANISRVSDKTDATNYEITKA